MKPPYMPPQQASATPQQPMNYDALIQALINSRTQAISAQEALAPLEQKWDRVNTLQSRGGFTALGEAIGDRIRRKKTGEKYQAARSEAATAMSDYEMTQKLFDIEMERLKEAEKRLYDLEKEERKFKRDMKGYRRKKKIDQKFAKPETTSDMRNFQFMRSLSPEDREAFKGFLSKGGITLETGPDGEVFFSQGGNGMSRRTQGQLETDAIAADEDLLALKQISELSNPEFLTYAGAAKGLLGRFADKSGMSGFDDQVQFNSDRSNFTKAVARRVFEYRKRITGVAGGEKEMAKIEDSLANAAHMGPEEFSRAVETEIGLIREQANLNRTHRNMEPIEFEPYQFEWGSEGEQKTGGEQSKVLNGKRYIMRDGEWYEE